VAVVLGRSLSPSPPARSLCITLPQARSGGWAGATESLTETEDASEGKGTSINTFVSVLKRFRHSISHTE
jgi:hypothetical protein